MKDGFIDVTDCDLRKLLAAAFDQSRPQGMGFMHHVPTPITDKEIDDVLASGTKEIPIRTDYLRGRSMKFVVFRENERLYVREDWYDHTPEQMRAVVAAAR